MGESNLLQNVQCKPTNINQAFISYHPNSKVHWCRWKHNKIITSRLNRMFQAESFSLNMQRSVKSKWVVFRGILGKRNKSWPDNSLESEFTCLLSLMKSRYLNLHSPCKIKTLNIRLFIHEFQFAPVCTTLFPEKHLKG